ncbi:hypothetical protein, partial [Ruminococcus callidus]
EIPQAYCRMARDFWANMTENLHADCVQSRQAGFMQCFLYYNICFRRLQLLFAAAICPFTKTLCTFPQKCAILYTLRQHRTKPA